MKQEKFKRQFASDNNSGIHPVILNEIASVNKGHVIGYGADPYTGEALKLFRQHFGEETETFFVMTGTAANVLGISNLVRSWNSVIAASSAHLHEDECGAPEKFTGCKVLTSETPDGKLNKELIREHLHGIDFEHHSQPKVVSVTQSTEMGTVYTVEEIREIAGFVHSNNMLLHMDGSRIANAAVSLGLPFRTFTTDAGVDVLSFGGTKNGMMSGEAVCFLRKGLAGDFKYVRKQGMQLASKMRFISAQYLAYFRNDLWKECAGNANRMARLLADRLQEIEGIRITQKVQANGVFVIMPPETAAKLMKTHFFYSWDETISEYRLMTSWDTQESDIDSFIAVLRDLL